MNREQAATVKAGDKVAIKPIWNNSERKGRQIDVVTSVLAVRKKEVSETGILFKVNFTRGGEIWLDAGWFDLEAVDTGT
jgi:hypothetical protein